MIPTIPERCAKQFAVEELLGRGAMGFVYRAVQVSLGRPVALKVGRTDLASPGDLARFQLEARLTSRLPRAGIPVVYDHGVDDGIPWIAYELLPGPDLHTALEQDGRLAPRAAADIGIQVLAALEAAHETGVIHRDIKPANIVAAGPDHWKVTDFGVARWRGCGALVSAPGLFVGTARYASPEQALGQEVVEGSDVYSLGCVLFELLTGRPLFAQASFVSCLRAHAFTPAPAPSSVCPGVPPALDRILLRALANPLAMRYASARAMRLDLEKALDDLPEQWEAAAPCGPGLSGDTPTEMLPRPVCVEEPSAGSCLTVGRAMPLPCDLAPLPPADAPRLPLAALAVLAAGALGLALAAWGGAL